MIEINGLQVSEDAMRSLVERVLWKQADGDLQTEDGCRATSNVVARFLTELGRDGYVPNLEGVKRSQEERR